MPTTSQTSDVFVVALTDSVSSLSIVQIADVTIGVSVGGHYSQIDDVTAEVDTDSVESRITPVVIGVFADSIETTHTLQIADVFAQVETSDVQYPIDLSLERYELFVAADEDPFDFDNPDETFTAFPHTTALTFAEGKHRIVVRRRNRWGLSSHNLDEQVIHVTAGGDEQTPPPSPPIEVTMTQVGGGKVRVRAVYYPRQDTRPDGSHRAATKWLVWIKSGVGEFTDPDPDVDPVTAEINMIEVTRGLRLLDYVSASITDGHTVKALVRTRRVDAGPVNVDSDSSNVPSLVIDMTGPLAPSAVPPEHFKVEG